MTDSNQKQQFLACLSDPSRFHLLATLAGGPRCVTELAERVGLSQSCTTRHLQALQREGIVTGERRGKRVFFSLGSPGSDSHPVLRWAFGELAAASAGAVAAAPTLRPRDPGPDRPGEPNGSERRRTRRAPESDRRHAPAVENSLEVTDALIVAHDRGWESDDLAADSAAASPPAPELDSSSRHGDESPQASRAHQGDLDDFLL